MTKERRHKSKLMLLPTIVIAISPALAAENGSLTHLQRIIESVSHRGTDEAPVALFADGTLLFSRSESDGLGAILSVDSSGRERVLFANSSAVSITPDGSRGIIASARPTGSAIAPDSWNLFETTREELGWSSPKALPMPVNSPFSECCAVLIGDGAFFFSSDRAGTWDIYQASPDGKGSFAVLRLPQEVNSEPSAPDQPGYYGEWPSHFDSAKGVLLFSSIRPGGLGGDDIYVSRRIDGRWRAAVNLGAPVNSSSYEDSPKVDPQGRVLIWSSRRPTDDGDRSANILSIDVDQVEALRR